MRSGASQKNPAYGTAFASVYDTLMRGTDYDAWAARLVSAIKTHMPDAKRGLDIAAGTGSITVRLHDAGFSMTGADASEAMLTVAREKSGSRKIEYILQDAGALSLLGKYDFAVMICDGMNYIDSPDVLFRKISGCLNNGGVFIFDISTEKKFSEGWGQNIFFDDAGNVFSVTDNSYDEKKRVLTTDLTLFLKNGDGFFEKHCERHVLRAYNTLELISLASSFFSVLTADFRLSHDGAGYRSHFICKSLT